MHTDSHIPKELTENEVVPTETERPDGTKANIVRGRGRRECVEVKKPSFGKQKN